MDNLRECLEILFKRIPPEAILKSFCEGAKNSVSYDKLNENIFINQALFKFKYYSEDEVRNIFDNLKILMNEQCEIKNRENGRPKDFPSVFNLLIKFGDTVLIESNGEPFCKYEHMLRWRMISHKLEQDVFTTSYLAYRDVLSSRKRDYFAWNPIISSNNTRLQRMLDEGLAENHFHLKGSAPVFSLSWISLMNNIVDRKKDFKEAGIINKRLEPDVAYGEDGYNTELYSLVKKAAIIRAFLFSLLKDTFIFSFKNDNESKEKKEIQIRQEIKKLLMHDEYLHMESPKLQAVIDFLRYQFGYNKGNFDGHAVDYAIPRNISKRSENSNKIIIGERFFLYEMFKRIYEKDISILEFANLFYAYLAIKLKFRSELIQNNNRVGFKNFADYQNRKGIFIQNEPLLKKAVFSMAISATMKNQNVKSLEARLIPPINTYQIIKEINMIDNILAKDKVDENFQYLLGKEKSGIMEYDNNLKHFYVLHFPKDKDKIKYEQPMDIDSKLIASMYPRHYEKRCEVKKQSLAVVSLRDSMKDAAQRILGIDACSNEIGCRPEVFAQAFRYLRNHNVSKENAYIFEDTIVRQLMATYHVGEDFLDIVDGLRAIDEVIKFLNFKHGDRLGHALSLGVDVEEWYSFKNHTLILPKQDYLDNIVWMLAKIRKFNIPNLQNLIYELESQYNKVFQEVYGCNFPQSKFRIFNHMTYYNSWKLRGDNPFLYVDGKFKENIDICYWDRCAVNHFYPKDGYIRENEDVAYLYHSYHFNPDVKRLGAQKHEFIVSNFYVEATKIIQKEFMKILARKGIGIETNPSSNYLIGTFKRYDKHPIINFYNYGLTIEPDKIKNCPQLLVSINTDDQGVFDTYLENEYALMSISLEKAKDENGNLLYNPSMIYDWLDRIRKMGLQQSFMGK